MIVMLFCIGLIVFKENDEKVSDILFSLVYFSLSSFPFSLLGVFSAPDEKRRHKRRKK